MKRTITIKKEVKKKKQDFAKLFTMICKEVEKDPTNLQKVFRKIAEEKKLELQQIHNCWYRYSQRKNVSTIYTLVGKTLVLKNRKQEYTVKPKKIKKNTLLEKYF